LYYKQTGSYLTMTDKNAELEAIAAEELTGDEQIAEVAADEPTKHAAKAMKPERLPGEVQDMGPAVVSPDAPSDPGKEASKKASQSKDLPRKGKPSNASPKPMGDGSGEMKAGAREEVEHEESEDSQVVSEADQEEASNEVTIEDRIANMDFSDDVAALTEGEDDFSDEFKLKAATIFEAAVKAKIREELEAIDASYAERFNSTIGDVQEELSEKVDGYLNYVVEEWMNNNEVAVEHALKTEITENFISGLKALFEEHNIAIPDDQFDMLDAAAENANELEGKLNDVMESNVKLVQENNILKRNEILLDVASDLADTEVEKFASLVENIDYENEEDFRQKVDQIKEGYFPKAVASNEETAATVESTEDSDMSDTMSRYMSAIARNEKRAGNVNH